jgi:SAM-dependent methyltransferase
VLAKLYAGEYFETWKLSTESKQVRHIKMATFHLRLRKIESILPDKGRVLDVGCATGFFLAAAESRGWLAYGVEPSPWAAGQAKQQFGDRVFQGTLEQADYPSTWFDCITMFDVLEHVTQPGDLIKTCHRILRPGGCLAIVTPNTESLTARVMRRYWTHYKLEHIHYYSPQGLSSLVEPWGFERIAIGPAVKLLTLSYIHGQLIAYPTPLLSPLVDVAMRIIPRQLAHFTIPLLMGEMWVLFRSR